MIDEFQITEITITGSENTLIHHYNLHLERHRTELEDMSLDELKRLSVFLASYLAESEVENG